MPRVTQAHVDARRHQILKAAYDRFARHGFHGTTMRDVAVAAGLSTGALYRYFDGKEELVRAVAAETRSTERHLLAPPDPDGSALDDLRAAVEAFVRVLDEPRARPALLLNARVVGEALDDPVLRSEVVESSRSLRDGLEELVERGRTRGEIRSDLAPEAVAAALGALLRGLGSQVLIDPGLDTGSLTRAVRALVGGLATAEKAEA